MKKYLFFTYGESGWRGVQVRGIRVASYFPQREVLFWNGGDSDFIKKAGFDVETKDLSLIPPSQIQFPQGLKVVVFCDVPTNEFFQFSLFYTAKKAGLRIVILEQLYRRGQTREYMYQALINTSDLLIYNGLTFQKSEEQEKVKLVPPLVEFEPESNSKEILAQKWQLPADVPWLYGVGYNRDVLEKIKEIVKKLQEYGLRFHFIVTGDVQQKQVEKELNFTILPYIIGDDYYRLIKAADLVFTKLGFLQILEVLAIGKPLVCLGGGGFVLSQSRDIIDKKIKDAIVFADEIKEAVKFCQQYLGNIRYKERTIEKAHRLHDGSLFGGRTAAQLIKEVVEKHASTQISFPKTLVIVTNEELLTYKNFIREHPGAYVMTWVMSVPVGPFIIKRPNDTFLGKKMEEIIESETSEILPHFFSEMHVFSRRKYDGLVEMMPWYEEWVASLQNKLESADTIYTTQKTHSTLKTLLDEVKTKVHYL